MHSDVIVIKGKRRGMSCHVKAGEWYNCLELLRLFAITQTLTDEVDAARHELLVQLYELLAFHHVHALIDPLLPVGLVPEVLRVDVDHATARYRSR